MSKKAIVEKYEKVVFDVLNVENFSMLNDRDKNGYYGLLMILSYMDGINCDIYSFSSHLGIDSYILETSFLNLRANGIFGSAYNVVQDKSLNGKDFNEKFMTNDHKQRWAWCYLAGIASGHTGLRT